MSPRDLTPSEGAGERATKNTFARAVGEIIGKLASLVLFAVLAREVSRSDLGAFVIAFAWVQIATTPVGLGYDRFLSRRVAKDRESLGDFLPNVIALKLARSVPVVAVSLLLVNVLGYDATTRQAVYALTAGLLLESLARTLFSVFNAFERSELVALTVIVQRVGAAALGLGALAAGFGVVAVSVTFTVGATLSFAIAVRQLRRHIGLPRLAFPSWARRELGARSLPFAAQDILGELLARLDAVILSLLVTAAVVGSYGAAYRLLESTFFISASLTGAFSAMFTYLGHDTDPSVRAVFERSIKAALVALVPLAVVFGVLADDLCRLLFGAALAEAAGPLRILAPTVVFLGVVVLSTSLIVSRRDPRLMVGVVAVVVAVNVTLNLVLIPRFEAEGAAAAMLVTAALFVSIVTTVASRTVGGVRGRATFAGPLLAGAAMGGALVSLSSMPVVALAVGLPAYVIVLLVVERWTSPDDLQFVAGMIRRRLPLRTG